MVGLSINPSFVRLGGCKWLPDELLNFCNGRVGCTSGPGRRLRYGFVDPFTKQGRFSKPCGGSDQCELAAKASRQARQQVGPRHKCIAL